MNTHKLQWWLMEKFGGSALCDDAGSAVEAEMLQGRPSGPWNPQRRPGAWERDDMSHVLRNKQHSFLSAIASHIKSTVYQVVNHIVGDCKLMGVSFNHVMRLLCLVKSMM